MPRHPLLRAIPVLLAAGLVTAAGCPLRQSDREPDRATWSEEIFLRVGEETPVDEGRLTVRLPLMDRGDVISRVTIRLTASSQTVEETVQAVRNTDYSEAVRLEPYAVRIIGYPGVDSARLLVERP